MEDMIIFLVVMLLFFIAIGLIGGIAGFLALARVNALRRELRLGRIDLSVIRDRQGPRQVPPRVASAPPPMGEQIPVEPSQAVVPPLPPQPVTIGSASAKPEPGIEHLESKIGQRWIAWAGAVVLFFSAAFFLKYAFNNNWIGPTGQVILCALVGAAMLAVGSRFIARAWRAIGQSVVGLGLAILYATFFAAFSLYSAPVLSQSTAFALMIAVTVAGMALAILHDALTIAFLAILGGLLTPVLVSTGQNARDALFTYLLLLDLGVLGVAFFRGWRLLDTLAMAGTFVLYAGWYNSFYQPQTLAPSLAWLGAFYLVFLVLPFLYHLIHRRGFTIERFVMALANAAFAAGFAWAMLRHDYLFAMGFVALAMGGAYLILGSVVRRRLPDDARSLFGAIALTVTFLTLAVPMQLRTHGILLAWVAEGPVLAYLAYRFRYRPARAFAGAVLVLGVARLFLGDNHWPLHSGLFIPFINRQFLSAIAVPAALALYALVHHRFRTVGSQLDRILRLIAALAAGLLTLIILHAEIGNWVRNDWTAYAADCAVAALWAIGALAYLLAGAKAGRSATPTWGVGAIALAIAVVLGAAAFEHLLGAEHVLFGNVRFGVCLLIVAAIFAYARTIATCKPLPLEMDAAGPASRIVAAIFFVVGLVGLLVLLSSEVYVYCSDTIAEATAADRAGQMSVTVFWSLYAVALLFGGFWRRWRPLRLAGLALFGLAALKLVLIDLTSLKDIYRIVSFFVLGLLMLAASYLYHKLEKRLAAAPLVSSNPPISGETQ